ncbi:uncharacterized protein LOC122902248 [Neovison vison]|uniref:uncharacterized protein LOC122902248 n=1 Tax=Neovison vison TaxID=452646 RepID=UPI001CEFC521|nr:uncharacterized protein LOC122902248 [Neogale vison]
MSGLHGSVTQVLPTGEGAKVLKLDRGNRASTFPGKPQQRPSSARYSELLAHSDPDLGLGSRMTDIDGSVTSSVSPPQAHIQRDLLQKGLITSVCKWEKYETEVGRGICSIRLHTFRLRFFPTPKPLLPSTADCKLSPAERVPRTTRSRRKQSPPGAKGKTFRLTQPGLTELLSWSANVSSTAAILRTPWPPAHFFSSASCFLLLNAHLPISSEGNASRC